jgi:hypothetical protein
MDHWLDMSYLRQHASWAARFLFFLFLGAGAMARAQQGNNSDQAPDQQPVRTPTLALYAANDGPAWPSSVEDDADLPDDPGALSGGQQSQPGDAHSTAPAANSQNQSIQGKQTKHILYIVPNFRAVSADVHLPRQTVKEKFKTASQDSFDYSSFIFVGLQAGLGQANNSYPEFHQGAAGYGRYYWHTFADATDENLWVEFLIPSALRQDTRYYTLGHGGFAKRLVYSFTRIAITRTDAGGETFNASEILGAGTAAGISNLYYPSQERTWVKSYQRWITNVAIDDGVFMFREFWPDINNKFFHLKD